MSLSLRTNYLFGRIKKSLPEMYAFTVCMWLKSSASPGIGTPFSYGVPGQANEIVLIEWGNNPIELLVNDKVGARGVNLPRTLFDYDYDVFDSVPRCIAMHQIHFSIKAYYRIFDLADFIKILYSSI